MGYLLKEGLKTLCGVNQWSYAVFWKFGCQNPMLLIWEECYYKPASQSDDFNSSWISAEASNRQAGDKVHLLVNKMMMDSHVNIVGEGLVGRVAITGNHQWILSETYCGDSHPPEVIKEVCQQFSAGMKTVAIIPVLPHGVVQFGSCMTVIENFGFINDVTSLILQLGYVSGALLSPNYEAKENAPGNVVPVGNLPPGASSFESNVANTPVSFDSINHLQNSNQYELQSNGAVFHVSHSSPDGIRHRHYNQEPRISLPVINGVAKAEVISSNFELWRNQNTSMNMPNSALALPSSLLPLNCITVRGTGQQILSDNVMHVPVANSGLMYCSDNGSVARPLVEVNRHCNGGMSVSCDSNSKHPISKHEMFNEVGPSNSDSVDCFTSSSSLAYTSDSKLHRTDIMFGHIYSLDCKKEMGQSTIQDHDIPGFILDDRKQIPYEDVCVQPELGDDLFDILGANFKNRFFSSCWNNLSNESAPNMPAKKSLASSELYSASQGNSQSGIFSSAASDNLLEAVVSKIQPSTKQTMDDNVSCRTTLTNASSSSLPKSSLPHGRFGVSEGELFGVPKYLAEAGAMSSCSSIKRSFKEESRSYSQGSSIFGSEISSWIAKDQKAKPCSSVSTSKTPDEMGKPNRKRLKTGENPRPRPKDRQVFQDRVKELRELVPNGAKCSLDALLGRTIKHMLYLQSVPTYADKLKQTSESKIISKDGGLLMKENFGGGATWAYEVGSQSMVCPIIVEDLNQPRQMLVQMLCEERGLFLEIADIIRGLGLTILMGVMETRNDKIWAQFAVEANRDVTRMEIVMSLVRILEQSSTGIYNENQTAQQFQQAASVPMAARPCSLQ